MPLTSRSQQLMSFLQKGMEQGGEGVEAGVNARVKQAQLAQQQAEQNQMLAEKADTAKRLETGALQTQYDKAGGGKNVQMKLSAINDARELLKNPGSLTRGQLSTAIARLRDVGALAEGDVERALPTTLRSSASKLAGFLGFPNAINSVNPEEIQTVQDTLSAAEKNIQGLERGAAEEVAARGPQIAPHLARTKELPAALQSLGIGVSKIGAGSRQTAAGGGAAPKMSFEDFKRAKAEGKIK